MSHVYQMENGMGKVLHVIVSLPDLFPTGNKRHSQDF